MDDDPVPRRCMGRNNVRSFVASTTLMATTVAKVQKQNVLSKKSDDDPKTKITIRANDITALTLKKEQAYFYNDFISHFTVKRQNEHGKYTQIQNLSFLVTNNCNLKNHHKNISMRNMIMSTCIPHESGESEVAKI